MIQLCCFLKLYELREQIIFLGKTTIFGSLFKENY